MRVPDRSARILLVAPQPFFELRGTPLNVLAMLRALCAAGHEVHLATYASGDTLPIDGLTYHRAMRVPGAGRIPIGFSLEKLANDASLALLVARLLAGARFDVVHAVEEALFFTLPLARLRGVPLIADLDSCMSDQLADSGTLRWPAALRLARAAEVTALRRADLAITVCRSLTEMVASRAPSLPVVQIEDCPPEGTDRPADPALLAELREAWNPDGVPLAVYTGNFASYQGLDLLFDALPALAVLVPTARLLVVGGGPAEIAGALEALRARNVVDRVRFAGQQPAERMAEFMALADVLVSPRTNGENTPLKIYAYMASGRPIVATDRRTHTQVLDDDTAFLCAPEPAALSAALAAVLTDPAAYTRRAAAARARLEREYSREAFAQKLLAAYDRVLPPGTRSSVASSI
ncbi:MAG: glycosyltransferase [Gemmatimonadaceae bacterium]